MATETSESDSISALRRLRAMALLVALVIGLGAVAATIIGALLVATVSLLNHALG